MVIPALQNPHLITVESPWGITYHGGSQSWYRDSWGRKAGCGPTNASNIVWYLARTRRHLASLCKVEKGDKAEFISLMDKMFGFVTPGKMGVHTTEMFVEKATTYFESMGCPITARVLNVPEDYSRRPTQGEMVDFIADALADDLPVAFLNLCNGKTRGLDRWHWVTIASIEPDSVHAWILDQGRKICIDLGQWLDKTTLGGGFVALDDSLC